MKRTAVLLNFYECVYSLTIAVVLLASGFAFARLPSLSEAWLLAPLALAPLGLLILAMALRWREFRR